MMGTVWSIVRGEVEKHDGRQPMLAAAIRINFAVNVGSASVGDCGIYRRDPRKHEDEPNILPAKIEKARKAAARKGRR